MSKYVKGLFQTPILVGKSDCVDICNKIADLSYKMRDSIDNASLLSEDWNRGKKSSDISEFKKKGVTSFHSIDSILGLPEWNEVGYFLYEFSKTLIDSVVGESKVNEFRIANSWTSIYPPGAFVPEHIHSNSILSGVFYAKAPKNCGGITFSDPCWALKTMFIVPGQNFKDGHFPSLQTKHTEEVEEGKLILFPSWLPHRSEINHSDHDRIIVSFNIMFKNPER